MMHDKNRRLPEAYEHMIERAAAIVEDLKKATPTLQFVLDEAKNRAVELSELTAEEASHIAEYIQQDLHDTARNFAEHERDFADWIKLDILIIEEQLRRRITSLVEVARQETRHIAKEPTHPLEWHTGEVTGIGILECKSCGKKIHFHQAGHIPPCPQCQGTNFQRSWKG